MGGQTKQLIRLIRFVGELKLNNYPNCESFSQKLRKLDLDKNIDISCSPKTIQRDIKLLKDKFGAPIEFDYEINGYYLKHHGWNFECPIQAEENILSWVLGAKLASDIVPDPVRSQIEMSIDELLTNNNPDFLDTAVIDTIIDSTSVEVKINPDIFRIVFNAWLTRKTLHIKYCPLKGDKSERDIDPQILTFFNEAWYIKSYCHLKKDVRVFALHRIVEAIITDLNFEYDKSLISGIKGVPFTFEKLIDIKVWCSNEIAGYIIEKAEHKKQEFIQYPDGSILLNIPAISKYDLIKWILSEAGHIKLIEPVELRTDIKEAARKIYEEH